MLSFIYRLANDFEQEQGFRPNVLYMNNQHFDHLKDDLAEIPNLDIINQLLGMEIVLDDELVHPHVYWTPVDWRRAVAV
ncbi:MAG: hypothetical protein SV201_15275 [Pseudomonadota bacterium]|nr:hypothetical protein [Pseudomonadota bacterium]